MSVNVQEIKEQIFNLNDPADKAFSLFEVINTLEENTIDLDPRIVKLVDDNFWKLF